MAKKRKGAKKGSASRSNPSKAKQAKKQRQVSPVPKKRVRPSKDRSRAARKGWETRRRENPLRWGSKAIAKKRKQLKEVDNSARAIERSWKEIERKALKQRAETEAAGGEHPDITRKL